jgi:hypothetical protein
MAESLKLWVCLPIYACLPCGVVKAIEQVQEHWTNITIACPVLQVFIINRYRYALILSLESIATSPDCKCKHEHGYPSNLGPGGASNVGKVKAKTKDRGSEHLCDPVHRIVECAGACIELRKIDVVKLVCVEPIRGEEHGKEKHDVGIASNSFPQSDEL